MFTGPRRGGEHMFTGGSSAQVGQVCHLTIRYVCSETTGHGIVPPNPQKATFQGCLERRPSTGVPLDYPKSGTVCSTCSPAGQVLIYGRLNIGMSTVCSTCSTAGHVLIYGRLNIGASQPSAAHVHQRVKCLYMGV